MPKPHNPSPFFRLAMTGLSSGCREEGEESGEIIRPPLVPVEIVQQLGLEPPRHFQKAFR